LQSDANVLRRGVVAVVLRERRFLVIRRSQNVIAPGALCFPGGGIEGGESQEQALVREFHEELGALIRPKRRVWQCTTRWHALLAWWLGDIDDTCQMVPNPLEVASIGWLTPNEMLQEADLLESNRAFLESLDRGEIVLPS
jgi:8-oxo-dGTP pyrophosphatase MutT (NUDIX family)